MKMNQQQQQIAAPAAPVPKRLKWEETETLLLVHSWITISQDPIVGDNQRDNTFWERIHREFHKDGTFRRTIKAMKNKWGYVNRDCQRYNGCLYIIICKNGSGETEEDRRRDAFLLYKERHKTYFTYQTCWGILSKLPKWNVSNTRPENPGSATGKLLHLR